MPGGGGRAALRALASGLRGRLGAIVAMASALAGLALAAAYLTLGPSACIAEAPEAPVAPGVPAGLPLAPREAPESPCEAVAELGWLELPLLGRVHLSTIALAYFALQATLAAAWLAGLPQARGASLALYAAGAAAVPYLAYLQYAEAGGFCAYCTGMYACIAAGLASCAASKA